MTLYECPACCGDGYTRPKVHVKLSCSRCKGKGLVDEKNYLEA